MIINLSFAWGRKTSSCVCSVGGAINQGSLPFSGQEVAVTQVRIIGVCHPSKNNRGLSQETVTGAEGENVLSTYYVPGKGPCPQGADILVDEEGDRGL